HAYGEIACGWHFSAGKPDVHAGRPGEPWILADARLGVQIPISARGWAGTFTPAQAGLTAWQFTLLFGRHLAGGGLSDPDISAKPAATGPAGGDAVLPPTDTEKKRWAISGALEIDCMVCHATLASGYDAGEIERQVERQNFRWSPTAALGLGTVRGDARSVSNDYDPDFPPPPDRPDLTPPKLLYDKTRFDADNRVLFDISREPVNERCLFCHTTRHVGAGAAAGWQKPPDVHMAAGMRCADCHSHGIDHVMNRGFAAEPPRTANGGEANALTCRGCHLGAAESLGGRGGAPEPRHAGIPPLHFEKLACTACHSGPWPDASLMSVQTSTAHALGISTKERREDALPHILEPVFVAAGGFRTIEGRTSGELTPSRLVWPAYWARRSASGVSLLSPEFVTKNAGRALPKRPGHSYEQASDALTDEQITAALTGLKGKVGEGGEPIYVRAGVVHALGPEGGLTRTGENGAGAYFWPLAHAVRPAQQSLGVRGCTDCHAGDSAIFFGTSAAKSAFAASQPAVAMHEFHGYDTTLATAWATVFKSRDLGKWVLAVVCGVLALALLRWAAESLSPRSGGTGDGSGSGEEGPAAGSAAARSGAVRRVIAIVAAVAAAFQGATSLLPAEFEGWLLLAHSAAVPVFLVAVGAWGVVWARSTTRRGVREWLTWCTLFAGLGLMTVMLLAMLPLFGTGAMRDLLAWHERFGIAMLVGLGLVAVVSIAGRRAPAKKG
ncbi:MAG: hypothetical protein IT450_19980, partial [Phycisphaerales bacterium]|nr:hypothetical protein [Phycisphaerales bacterium]